MRVILQPLPLKESHRETIEKIHKVYKVRTYGNERPPELVKRELYYFPVVSYRLAVDLPHLMDNPTG